MGVTKYVMSQPAANQPASQIWKKWRPGPPGGPRPAAIFSQFGWPAGWRLVGPSHIWLPPSILGVYYVFCILLDIFSLSWMGGHIFQYFRTDFCDCCELFLLIQDPLIFVFWDEISNFGNAIEGLNRNCWEVGLQAPHGQGAPARRHFFQIWLAGWLAHHIFGYPHPFWGYIMYFVYNLIQ